MEQAHNKEVARTTKPEEKTASLTVPDIENEGDSYTATWEDGVIIRLSYLEAIGKSKLTIKCEIEVEDYTSLNPHLYGPTTSNITGSLSVVVKEIEKDSHREDWNKRFTQLKKMVIPHFRQGEPVMALGSIKTTAMPREIVKGLMWEGSPTLIFGPGGIGKSIIALNICSAIHTGRDIAGLETEQGNVLYLDWETSADQTHRRNKSILESAGVDAGAWPDPDYPKAERTGMMFYRFMAGPLMNEVKYLKEQVIKLGITTVCVDSAGPACGGEPESAEATLKFFEALRAIGPYEKPLQALILAHVTHENKRTGKSAPFGSVYWENMPRNVFELSSEQAANSSISDCALYHKKTNTGPLLSPTCFRLTWDNGCTMSPLDIRQNAELFKKEIQNRPIVEQVLIAIDGYGPMTIEELSKEIGQTKNSVEQSLERDNRIERGLDGKWKQTHKDW